MKDGGVPLLLRSGLKFLVLPYPVETELFWCTLHLSEQSVVIDAFYRPPGCSVDCIPSLSEFILEHNFSAVHFVRMDDFNAPGLN